jgi:hypothetical protein
MHNNYKHPYSAVQVPSVQSMVAYADPIRTDEERQVRDAQIAKQQAQLHREKLAERWVVFTAAFMMAIAMLPVLVVVGVILLAKARWQRFSRVQEWQRNPVTTDVTRMPTTVPFHRGSRESGTPPLWQDRRTLFTGDACAA